MTLLKSSKMTSNARACPLEHDEQVRVFGWAQWQHWQGVAIGNFLAAVPNGSALTKRGGVCIQSAKLKAEGVQVGFPDLMLLLPSKGKHGLFIEMKRRDKRVSRVSKEQLNWIDRLNQAGYQAQVCYGSDEAIAVIKDYLGII